jgi:chloride channel protein, CIC family
VEQQAEAPKSSPRNGLTMIKREFFDSHTWQRYLHLRKYFAVVHTDLNETYARHVGKWLLIAPVIGVLTGLVIVLEVVVILHGIWAYLLPRYGTYHWMIIPGVLVGFGATGLIMRYLTPDPDLHSTDEVVRSYHEHHGDLDLKSYWAKMLASVTTIAFGGSVGLEGPSIYAGAGVGSWLWTKVRGRNVSRSDRQVMLISGAAAGLGAVFRAPLTGLIFGLEMPFRDDLAHEALLPSLISSVVAYSTLVAFLGSEPLFAFNRTLQFHDIDLVWAALLGLISGLVTMAFSTAFRKLRASMIKLPIPHPLKLLLGGLGVGLCGLVFATLFGGRLLPLGPDYEVARNLLANQYSSLILVSFFIVKAAAALLTLGCGGVGAMFVPLMLLGESLGRVFGQSIVSAPAVDLYCAIGMAAFIAGGYKTPLAAVAFVAETTGTPAYLIPTFIGAAVAYAASGDVSVVLSQRLRQAPKLSQPIGLKARDIMRTQLIGAQSDATLQEFFSNIAANNHHPTYPVFKGKRAIGSISLWEVTQVPSSRWSAVKVGEVARSNLPQVELDTDLREVVRVMNQQQRHRLVLITDSDGVPAGLITPSDIISALSVEDEPKSEAGSRSDAAAQ